MVWWVKHMNGIGLKILQKTPTVERLNLNETVRTAVSQSNHIFSIKSPSFRRLLDNYLLLQCDSLKALTNSAKVNKKVQNWSFSLCKANKNYWTTHYLKKWERKKSLLSRPYPTVSTLEKLINANMVPNRPLQKEEFFLHKICTSCSRTVCWIA